MKKILKVCVAMLVLMIGMVFAIPTVSAETTTELTTEEVTTLEEADSSQEITDIKNKIQVFILAFLGSTTFSAIGGVIINQLKKKALAKLNEAVASNVISQDTANMATQAIEKFEQEALVKITELQTQTQAQLVKQQEMIDELKTRDDRVETLLDKYEERDSQLAQLLEDTLGDDVDD